LKLKQLFNGIFINFFLHCCGGSAKKNTCLGLNAVIKEKHDVDANRFLINISGPCANILMFFICIIIKNYFNAGYNMRFFFI